MTKLQTFLRHPGNKTRHLKHIIPHLPERYNTYIEPFVGTGALFLNIQPKKWIINDLNEDITNLFKTVRDDLPNIIKLLKSFATRTKFKDINNEKRLLLMRKYLAKFIEMSFDTKRCLYYIILKYSSYKSNIIFKDEYKFTGLDTNLLKGLKPAFLSDRYYNKLINASKSLNTDGKIYNEDYKNILKKTRKYDFCFIDPPYIEDHDYQFSYNTTDKTQIDFIEELYNEVKKLDKKSVFWLMTHADTSKVRERYKEYTIIPFPVYRGFKNKYSTELIIKNY